MITRPSFGLCVVFTGGIGGEEEDPDCNGGNNTKRTIAIAIAAPTLIATPMIFLFNNTFKN
jgi:hypothetical protein